MRIGIALGSNLEDRLQHLRAARDLLLALHESEAPFLSSAIYETRPVDCPEGSLPFLNAAIALSSMIAPHDFLDRLHTIELQLGRPSDHLYHAPRTIDLDLLYCDSITLSCGTLTLPHPRISERLFVLQPLADICPERILPCNRHSIRVACEQLVKVQGASDIREFHSSFN